MGGCGGGRESTEVLLFLWDWVVKGDSLIQSCGLRLLIGILDWSVRLIVRLASVRLSTVSLRRSLLVVWLLVVLALIRLLVWLLIGVWLTIRIKLSILTLRHSHLRGLRIYVLIRSLWLDILIWGLWLVVKILTLRCLRIRLSISLINWLMLYGGLDLRNSLRLGLDLDLRLGLSFLRLSEAKWLSLCLYLWGWSAIKFKNVNSCSSVCFRSINRCINLWCSLFNWFWLLSFSWFAQFTCNFFKRFFCFNYNIWLSFFSLLLSC